MTTADSHPRTFNSGLKMEEKRYQLKLIIKRHYCFFLKDKLDREVIY